MATRAVAVKNADRKTTIKEVPTIHPISPHEMGFFYAIVGKTVRRKKIQIDYRPSFHIAAKELHGKETF